MNKKKCTVEIGEDDTIRPMFSFYDHETLETQYTSGYLKYFRGFKKGTKGKVTIEIIEPEEDKCK